MSNEKKPKGMLDSFFDVAEKVVGGAESFFKDIPGPGGEEGEEAPPSKPDKPDKRVIDVPVPESVCVMHGLECPPGCREPRANRRPENQPLFKSGDERGSTPPRKVVIEVKKVIKRASGGVTILAELATHEIVAIQLAEKDWKKVCDEADWMRMVQD